MKISLLHSSLPSWWSSCPWLQTLRGSNAQSSQHVYELRMYHVPEGKAEALKNRFGDHTDAIFKRHNMKSVGYWVPEDAPNSQNLFIYILEHPSRRKRKKIGQTSRRIRNGNG